MSKNNGVKKWERVLAALNESGKNNQYISIKALSHRAKTSYLYTWQVVKEAAKNYDRGKVHTRKYGKKVLYLFDGLPVKREHIEAVIHVDDALAERMQSWKKYEKKGQKPKKATADNTLSAASSVDNTLLRQVLLEVRSLRAELRKVFRSI